MPVNDNHSEKISYFYELYITIRGKGELLAKLRKAAKKADKQTSARIPLI